MSAPAIAEGTDEAVNRFIGDLCRDSIHPGLAIERLPQRCCPQAIGFPAGQDRQTSRIKIFQCSVQRGQITQFLAQPMAQIGCRFEWAIISRIVVLRQLDRIFRRAIRLQLCGRSIIGMAKNESRAMRTNFDLPDPAGSGFEPIRQHPPSAREHSFFGRKRRSSLLRSSSSPYKAGAPSRPRHARGNRNHLP